MDKSKGMLKIGVLENSMLSSDGTNGEDVAKEFGSYLVRGSYVPVTPELIHSPDFSIRGLYFYTELPGNFHGNRSMSNFFADVPGVERLNKVVDDFREVFS